MSLRFATNRYENPKLPPFCMTEVVSAPDQNRGDPDAAEDREIVTDIFLAMLLARSQSLPLSRK
jgi:hypothetical protein